MKLARDTVLMWLDLWKDNPGLKADERLAWRTMHDKLVANGKVRLNLVTGPLAATIATMGSMGWKTPYPEQWTDPSGTSWAMGADGTRKEVEQLIEDITVQNCGCMQQKVGSTADAW